MPDIDDMDLMFDRPINGLVDTTEDLLVLLGDIILNINDFIIAGADATACVKSTCFNMRKADYTVSVLSDCVTSYDKTKIDEMLQYYESKGCRLITVNELSN